VLDTRNMSSSVTENKSLHIAASCWTFIDILSAYLLPTGLEENRDSKL